MMSIYSQRRNQIDINKKNTMGILPKCHDNRTFLPDVQPTTPSLSTERQMENNSFCHSNNKMFPTSKNTITKTKGRQQSSPTAFDKRTLYGKNHNASVSADDVNITIGDTLPVIMHHLYLGSNNLTTTTVKKDSINIKLPTNKHQSRTTSCSIKKNSSGNKLYYKMPPATNFYSTPEALLNDTKITPIGNEQNVIDMPLQVSSEVTPTRTMLDTLNESTVDENNRQQKQQQQQQQEKEMNDFHFNYGSTEITNKKKRFTRLKRSATNDESMFKISENIKTEPLSRCQSIDCPKGLNDLTTDQDLFTRTPTKPTSRRKQLRRSVSLGFSKFKLISNFNLRTHQRLADDDIAIDVKETEYQTSRRKNTIPSETQQSFEELLNAESLDNLCHSKYPLLRSISAPESLEPDSDYDEDLSELYLPRRRAICPNLPVPAMKQLKTYLILTRLKQYCFV